MNSSVISVMAANLPCNIVVSTESSITCVIQPDVAGNTYGKLPTTTIGTQQNGFISGTGFFYQRYDLTKLPSLTVGSLINAISSNSVNISLVEEGIRGDL